MSRYDALRDSDDEDVEDDHVPSNNDIKMNQKVEENQNGHNSSGESDVEEIIIPPSSPRVSTSNHKFEPAPHSGGMVVERIDKLTESLTNAPTDSEIETCIKVLSFIGSNISLLKLNHLKPIRVALQPLLEGLHWGGGEGNGEKGDMSHGKKGKKRKNRNEDNDCLAEKERNYINQTQLKALRRAKLEKLNEDGFNLRIPDGVALLPSSVAPPSHTQLLLDGTAPSAASSLELANASSQQQQQTEQDQPQQLTTFIHTLRNPLSCYICHKPYIQLHFFYHQLCPDCAIFNYSKREEMANMTGMVCVVTGGRTKIGYRTALKLLRCGATVIVTTRFPVNAAETYSQETDSANWMNRLQIFGLDFRDISKLEAFCHFIECTYDRLDVLINNACQTVRRPPAYYSHLIEKEETYHAIAAAAASSSSMATPLKSLPYQAPVPSATHQGEEMEEMASPSSSPPHGTPSMTIPPTIPILLEKQNQFLSAYSSHQAAQVHRDQELIANSASSSAPSSALSVAPVPVSSASLHNISSAQMSQLTFLPEEKSDHLNPATLQLLFPVGHRDVNNQQIDLRNHNSWTMKLDEVPTVELAEVFAINTIAPTILNARLKPLMKRTKPLPVVPPVAAAASGGAGAAGAAGVSWKMNWKFVVNVSAMEGKFYRYKSSNHPHTNMAKAALNMMTRTSAQDYRQDNIFMTAVDTGWINDEKPIEKAMKHEEKHDFQTPLDEIDAASRVLDPVIGPLRALQDFFQQQETTDAVPPKGMEPPWGHFIKDYMKSEW